MPSDSEAHDPKLGTLLMGRYRIVRKLGEGGMGAVYEGRHELIGKRLAIKCLHPQYVANEEVVQRFQREASAATAVGNEHIIEVFDVGTFEDGSPFMVMEFLEGVELGETLDDVGALPYGRLVHIMLQVCEALHAAHQQGIVHRDLKPENIFLVQRGQDSDFVKVLDFGISKVRDATDALDGGLTKTGMALGTPYYMPPEQAQGVRDVDARADVYAAGVIIFQAVTGRMPFEAQSYPALMVKILTEPTPMMSQFRQDVPDDLETLVQRAMAKDRDRRLQNMAELAAALHPHIDHRQTPVMLRSLGPTAGANTAPFSWSDPAPSQRTSTGAATARGPVDALGATASLPPAAPKDTRTPGPTTSESLPPPKTGGRMAMVLAILTLLAAVTAGIWFWQQRSGDPSIAAATEDPDSGPRATGNTGAAPPPPNVHQVTPQPLPVGVANPGKPTEVNVSISAQPPTAHIFIDDVEFPNPTEAFRPRSLDPVRVRIEASGYRSVEQLAIFDQNRTLSFELERGSGTKRLKGDRPGGSRPKIKTPHRKPKVKNPGSGTKAPSAATQASAGPPRVEPAAAKPTAGKPAGDKVYRGPTGSIRNDF